MRVLVSDPIAERGIEALRREAETDVAVGLSPEQLIARIGEYDALVTRSETKATAAVIAAGRRLKVIGRAGVGVDNIDVEAATAAGILVVNVPGANTLAAAEHAFGLMLALARHIPQACADLKGGQWRRTAFVGTELHGKTLGVLGLGRIGAEMAARARAFGMEVLAYDPFVSRERAALLGVRMGELEEVLEESDFITLHMAKTPETAGILSRARLRRMKRGARLINCARGGMVDEPALYDLLVEGHLAGAALDVFAQEPPRGPQPLFELPQVVVTPHLAASTLEAQDNNGLLIAEAVLSALRGEAVLSAVNLPAVTPEESAALRPSLAAAEMLGRFCAQAWPQPVEAVELEVTGEIARGSLSLLSNAALVGLLVGHLSEPINLINARMVAQRRGIRVLESRASQSPDYTNLVTLRVRGGGVARSVAGHMAGPSLRIVELNGYQTEFIPSRWMIVVQHHDRPGMIGRVGMLLGQADVNIAGMQVARATPRGEAVMVLQLDDEPSDAVIDEVRRIEGLVAARKIHLPGVRNGD